MGMLRLTLKLHEDGVDTARCAARLRGATPIGVRVAAAFLDGATLDIYLEADAGANIDAAIDRIVTAFGADDYRTVGVVQLPVEAPAPPAPVVPATQLASVHRGQIVGVTVSPDCRELSVNVRHRHYERIDRLDVSETEHEIHLTAWVGTNPDDPRGDYATFADTFSAVDANLGGPVGARRISYDS
jgi:hypothetical protein